MVVRFVFVTCVFFLLVAFDHSGLEGMPSECAPTFSICAMTASLCSLSSFLFVFLAQFYTYKTQDKTTLSHFYPFCRSWYDVYSSDKADIRINIPSIALRELGIGTSEEGMKKRNKKNATSSSGAGS